MERRNPDREAEYIKYKADVDRIIKFMDGNGQKGFIERFVSMESKMKLVIGLLLANGGLLIWNLVIKLK
jgi:hypothetical protein